MARTETLETIVGREGNALLDSWMKAQLTATTLRRELIDEEALRRQSSDFLAAFARALERSAPQDVFAEEWNDVRDVLDALSRERARAGFSPTETATFVFSLKQPLFELLQSQADGDLSAQLWRTNVLLDQLGLYTAETFQRTREQIIKRQQAEILELSTPVVQLWEGVVGVPLIGTLDSERTQIVMENLLQLIVETGASLAIIDITGVPTVDTLVAQHLIKTVSAARLMGADCIISGIRPQIAQTIVHLGIDLTDVTTKANLADAIALALQRLGFTVNRPERD